MVLSKIRVIRKIIITVFFPVWIKGIKLTENCRCLPDKDSFDNQDIVMIYWDRSANELSIKKYDDSEGALGSWSETSIAASMVDSSSLLQMNAMISPYDGQIIV